MSNLVSHYDNWHNNYWCKNINKTKVIRYEKIANQKILDMLNVEKGKNLLDIGCGKGSFCNSAFHEKLNVYGVDFSKAALKEAESLNKKIKYILADASSLPFKSEFFDYIVCLGSLEHFTDKKNALNSISRILKKNGKAFFFLPNSYFLGHIYMVYKTGLPLDEAGQEFSEDFNTKLGWKNLLEGNSLKVLSIYKFNTIWASGKVSTFTKYFYNFILKSFIPFNLSYSFGYLCVKK